MRERMVEVLFNIVISHVGNRVSFHDFIIYFLKRVCQPKKGRVIIIFDSFSQQWPHLQGTVHDSEYSLVPQA